MNSETARFAFHHDFPQEQSECQDRWVVPKSGVSALQAKNLSEFRDFRWIVGCVIVLVKIFELL